MKTLYYLITWVLFCTMQAYSQTIVAPVVKFGQVDEEDVKAKFHPLDREAEAVYLHDQGKVHITFDYQGIPKKIITYHGRVKILKKEAFSRATISYRLYNNSQYKENISNIKGFTHNEEGGKIVKRKLEKSAIFEERVNKEYKKVSFTLPNVREGSVIEYSYTITSDIFWQVDDWYFQKTIPVVWSQYELLFPEYLDFAQVSQGYDAYLFRDRGVENVPFGSSSYSAYWQRWAMKDLQAFKFEKYMTTPEDYINKLEFQLSAISSPNQRNTYSAISVPNQLTKTYSTTWAKLTSELLESEYYGDFVRRSGQVKDVVAMLTNGLDTPQAKTLAIYNYVKTQFRYNGQDHLYPDQKIKELLASKKGSSTEINLLMVNMMQEAGLNAYPVLLSTRWHGKINPTYPLLQRFNYSIALVSFSDTEKVLLDATEPLRGPGMLPIDVINGKGLVLIDKKGQHEWVELQNNQKNTEIYIGTLAINKEGNIQGKIRLSMEGFDALYMRKKILNKQESSEPPKSAQTKDTDGEINEKRNDYIISKASFENLKDLEKPLKAELEMSTNDFAESTNGKIYLSPLLNFKMEENPFKEESRTFPIDFGILYESAYYLTYTIPEGYEAEFLPEPVRILSADKSIKVDYIANLTGSTLQVVNKISVNRSFFFPEEYPMVRQFYTAMLQKQNEQIVLRKKNN